MSNADRVQMAVAKESTWGTAPASGWNEVPITGESVGHDKETIQSNTIRSDRMNRDVLRAGVGASGDLNFELSYGGAFDDLLEAALLGAWSTNVLKNAQTEVSLAVQRGYLDLTAEFEILTGMMVQTLNLTVTAGEVVTGSVGLIGENGITATATAGTVTAANANLVFSAVDHVPTLKEGGIEEDMLSFTLSLNNNLRLRRQIGDANPIGTGQGNLDVTGSIQIYYDSATADVFDKFVNHTASSLRIILNDGSNSYDIVIPAVKYTTGRRNATGQNNDVIADLGWAASRDATENAMIKITRSG